MRRIKAIKTEAGISPDWPVGQPFPPNDENVEGVVCNGEEYLIYETGDELPDSIKPKLHLLRPELHDNIVLWRYMDFPRLYSLVTSSALFFTPGVILRSQEPYEMRVPMAIARANREAWTASYQQHFPDDPEGAIQFQRFEQVGEDSLLYGLGISCWHINNRENNALWKVFVGNKEGVAIKTTIGALRRALDCRHRYISADRVEYIDYEQEGYRPHSSASGFEQIYHKARFFEYEQEFRLAYRLKRNLQEFELSSHFLASETTEQIEIMKSHFKAQREAFMKTGPFVPVNLNVLIQEVVVSPGAGMWFCDLVARLIANHLDSEVKIRPSVINQWPVSSSVDVGKS